MQTKYGIVISVVAVIILGLMCFLIWWFRIRASSNVHKRINNYTAPEQDHVNKNIDKDIPTKIIQNEAPKVVYMSYYDINSIPASVWRNFEKCCHGYRIEIHGNQSCEDFLYEYYGSNAMQVYREIKDMNHKAYFWGCCMLYAKGGYYLSIELNLKVHIDNIFKFTSSHELFSVQSNDFLPDSIRNGFIVTHSKNPILWEVLSGFYQNINKNNPFQNNYLSKLISSEFKTVSQEGTTLLKNGWKYTLFKSESRKPGGPWPEQDWSIINSDNESILDLSSTFSWPKIYASTSTRSVVIDDGKNIRSAVKPSIAIIGSFQWHYECVGFLLDILGGEYRIHVYHNDLDGFIDLFSKTYIELKHEAVRNYKSFRRSGGAAQQAAR